MFGKTFENGSRGVSTFSAPVKGLRRTKKPLRRVSYTGVMIKGRRFRWEEVPEKD